MKKVILNKKITWAKTHPTSQSISLLWLDMTSACSLPGNFKTESDYLYASKCCPQKFPLFLSRRQAYMHNTRRPNAQVNKRLTHQSEGFMICEYLDLKEECYRRKIWSFQMRQNKDKRRKCGFQITSFLPFITSCFLKLNNRREDISKK